VNGTAEAVPFQNKMEARHLSRKFEEAFQLAFELHQTKGKQGRKGKDTPYVSHLMAVAALVLEFGGSEEEAIAALLHDAVEDQGGPKTLKLIEERFGAGVAQIVKDCSDYIDGPKPAWHERKTRYIEHLPHVSASSRRVSLADKIHNAGTILRDVRYHGVKTFDHFNGKRTGTLWYYDALARTFLEQKQDEMAKELDRIVNELYAAAHEERPKELAVPEN
jgi:(p)ppGpp synthase/HD superfamily hydrolase